MKLRKPILGDEGIITLMGALARCDVKGGTVTWPYQVRNFLGSAEQR